jgi:hypothetical protein
VEEAGEVVVAVLAAAHNAQKDVDLGGGGGLREQRHRWWGNDHIVAYFTGRREYSMALLLGRLWSGCGGRGTGEAAVGCERGSADGTRQQAGHHSCVAKGF